jgi:flavin-dependent dehydrogenase
MTITNIAMPTRQKVTHSVDVCVVGGGQAGLVAAIQAGRAGAKTLLVEKTATLGGNCTNGGVNFPGIFHAWGRQVIAGIGWELVSRCVAEAGGTLPEFADYRRSHTAFHVRVDSFLYAALCDEAVVAAGVEILFHTMPAALAEAPDGDGWEVTLCTKTGLSNCRARVVIDATGDANAASLAGLPVIIPDETQPATLSCCASGYDLDHPGVIFCDATTRYQQLITLPPVSFTLAQCENLHFHLANITFLKY